MVDITFCCGELLIQAKIIKQNKMKSVILSIQHNDIGKLNTVTYTKQCHLSRKGTKVFLSNCVLVQKSIIEQKICEMTSLKLIKIAKLVLL